MSPAEPAKGGVVTGLFKDRENAELGWRAAIDLGYDKDDINLVLSEETRGQFFPGRGAASELSQEARKAADEPAAGAEELGGPTGGTIGTIAPALAAVGALMLIPGGIVAAGPIAIALTAGGAVGVTGGLIGALTNWGISKGRVELYEEGIRKGGVLMGVKTHSEGDAERLAKRWQESGGELVHC